MLWGSLSVRGSNRGKMTVKKGVRVGMGFFEVGLRYALMHTSFLIRETAMGRGMRGRR